MSTPPPDEPKHSPAWRILAGGLIGDLAMAALYAGLMWVGQKLPPAENRGMVWIIAIPSLVLIPLLGGLVAAWIWRPLKLGTGEAVLHSLWMPFFAIVGAAAFFHEGVVCLVLVTPLLWASILAGVCIGNVWFRPDRSRLNLCIFPLVALLAAGEMETRIYERESVVDTMLIHAPPQKVWPHVLAFPSITEQPRYWLFRIGLPYPMATTNGGNFVGADRRCIFSSGVVIKETVAEFLPARRLAFDIAEQPTEPEAYGHITLHRGCFELQDNHDGTTTLIGTSWYTLHVSPLFYFDWWVRDMTHAVHLRVMRHVRDLSERAS